MLQPKTYSFTSTLVFSSIVARTTQAFGYCNWGVLGTGDSSTCNGEKQGGDWCNQGKENCDECGGRWCKGEGVDVQSNSRMTPSPNLLPLAPSDEFCKSNSLGDDLYYSLFVPCKLTFYNSENVGLEHFSCKDINNNDILSIEMRHVTFWPDSCIGRGPRCYSLIDYPDLITNFTLFAENPAYSITYSKKANLVSVDCTADFDTTQEVWNNLPDELHEVADAIMVFSFTVVIGTIACIVAVCCCCKRRKFKYASVPDEQNSPDPVVPVKFRRYDGRPVIATAKPGYQAVV